MKNSIIISGLSALISFILLSCSSGGPSAPTLDSKNQSTHDPLAWSDTDRADTHYLWGYYLLYLNPEIGDFEVMPVRNITGHWNVLKWLEQAPCTDCLKIVSAVPSGSGTLLVDIRIAHPFSSLNLTGFDVRGIAMFNGSRTFPAMGLTLPDMNSGDGELVNADGFTTLYDAPTAGSGPGGLQGYIKGKLATATPPSALVNGYKRHITNNPANTRNAFYGGDNVTVTYEIKMPTSAFVFGYAVDASWVAPTTTPVTDPMTDFPPNANCPEPWKLTAQDQPIGDGLTDQGGSTNLVIDVYDYQGKDSYSAPEIECPELFDGTLSAAFLSDEVGFTRYQVTVSNVKLAPIGSYECLIIVLDNEDATAPLWLDLTAYQVFTFQVNPAAPSAWAKTWGGIDDEEAEAVAVDPSGNAYVAGSFAGTADFDPGAGTDDHTSNGEYDAFLASFDISGNFRWARTWGGIDDDQSYAIAVDASGNAFITGYFIDTVDFDPGSGIDNRTSNGSDDVFLTSFDSSGNFRWARTWGSSDYDDGNGVAVDNAGNVYVTGWFWSTIDFDPGSGTDEHTSNGGRDSFFCSFDSGGVFRWARTWGGMMDDLSMDAAADFFDNLSLSGWFYGSVDFDPGAGTDVHASNGGSDIFVSNFDSSGNFLWARTWGGIESEGSYGVAADYYSYVYVTGQFRGTVDFDPGSGTEDHSAVGFSDGFLSKFDSGGNFQWARTWGGSNNDWGDDIAADINGDSYITGRFQGTVDFDPGSGTDEHISNGNDEAFLSRFDTSGLFKWAGTWGGTGYDYGRGVAVDSVGNVFATGWFQGTVDFDLGPGTDDHISNGGTDAYLIRSAAE